jgi:hypothetical protein
MTASVRFVLAAICALAPAAAAAQPAPAAPPPTSPLAIHIGDADFLIGGFIDALAVVRSTNVGSGPATTYATIPFENTPQGNLGETRLSSQSTRLNLLVTTKVGDAAVKGFVEIDFLGADPGNAFVTANAHPPRLRHGWLHYARGHFDFTGGQAWTLLTPNRNGLSPVSSDVITTQTLDPNLHAGLTWARQTQFRFVAHASKTVAAGVSIENPQPFVGSAVVLPASFPASEVDAGATTGAPSPYPDIIGKVAFDPQTGKLHQHVEAAVIVRGFRTYSPASGQTFSSTGSGVSLGGVFEPAKTLHVIATTFISSGGGRYMIGLAPDFIVNADGSTTLVGSTSTLAGVEAQVTPAAMLFGYYGAVRIDREVGSDNGKPIGYGIDGSTAANHTIDETTAGLNYACFRSPQRGALQVIAHYSYVTRTPWSVPAGTPASAHVHMLYVGARYVLP